MYLSRTVEKLITKTATSFPVVVVYGPRQVGKSTTVLHMFGKHCQCVTLDDADDRMLATENPRLFLETYPWPVIIDEIQKAPALLDAIKIAVDKQKYLWLNENRKPELMYILTGSNRFELQQGISDSLAGRCGIVEMDSLSAAEKYHAGATEFFPDLENLRSCEREAHAEYRSRSAVFQDIFQGGMPEIVEGGANRELYYKSYIDTYIEKDVRQLIDAAKELQFRKFISVLALRTGQELKYDRLAADAGIDARTCKRWISILETSGLIYLLQPYSANLSKRIIKAPKIYFMDTGLCAALCKWPNAQMLEDCAMSGAFFETYVVSEIVKNLRANGRDPDSLLFYYRDIDQKEIDLIYAAAGRIYPLEIKKGLAPSKPDKNFSVLKKFNVPAGTGIVIDCCEKMRPISEEAWSFPVYLLGM